MLTCERGVPVCLGETKVTAEAQAICYPFDAAHGRLIGGRSSCHAYVVCVLATKNKEAGQKQQTGPGWEVLA